MIVSSNNSYITKHIMEQNYDGGGGGVEVRL